MSLEQNDCLPENVTFSRPLYIYLLQRVQQGKYSLRGKDYVVN